MFISKRINTNIVFCFDLVISFLKNKKYNVFIIRGQNHFFIRFTISSENSCSLNLNFWYTFIIFILNLIKTLLEFLSSSRNFMYELSTSGLHIQILIEKPSVESIIQTEPSSSHF